MRVILVLVSLIGVALGTVWLFTTLAVPLLCQAEIPKRAVGKSIVTMFLSFILGLAAVALVPHPD